MTSLTYRCSLARVAEEGRIKQANILLQEMRTFHMRTVEPLIVRMVDSLRPESGGREWRPTASSLSQHTPEFVGVCGVSCELGTHADDGYGLCLARPAIVGPIMMASASHIVLHVEIQTSYRLAG